MRKAVGGFVGGQAVFVQATELGARVQQHHAVAQARQAVGAGQACGPGAHHRHEAPGGGCAGKQGRAGVGHQVVGGIALQQANFDRLVFVRVAHAGLFAQHLGGADPGAHAAQGVGLQNGARRAARVVVGNAADKAGHVNAGGAGGLAGRVKAVVAAVGLNLGLRQGQRWVRVAKVVGVLRRGQATGVDSGRQSVYWHGVVSNRVGGIKMAC